MDFEDYRRQDATGLAKLVAGGEVTAEELLEAALARQAAVNPSINAIVIDDEAYARKQLDASLPEGPFRGVPFLLKDLYAFLEGTKLTNGSRLISDFVCPADNTYVARCKAAGLMFFGKTNSPEFGFNVTTEPIRHGPTRNPWDLDHSVGGSSGGAAAAIAAGIVPMAHASDGGGSIRIPASSCGLVGLKTSRARNPIGPVIGEGWNGMAGSHVITRSVRDTALMLDCTAGLEQGDPYTCPAPERPFADEVGKDPGQLRIGLLSEAPSGTPVDPVCKDAVSDAAKLLESLGHHVEEAKPDLEGARLRGAVEIVACSHAHADFDNWHRTLGVPIDETTLERATLALAERGKTFTGADYAVATITIHQSARSMGRFFANYDVLLTPTLGGPPPKHGIIDQNMDDLGRYLDLSARHIPFTPLYNTSGCPAISLPLYWNEDGLPIGVMFGAKFGGEATLLRLAAQLEQARPWFDRLPPEPGSMHR